MSCGLRDWVGFVLPWLNGRHPENVCGGNDAVKIVGISEKSRNLKA